jgi:hypothetical protein
MITETVSEKPKRGRPAKYAESDMRRLAKDHPWMTRRGLQNLDNEARGIGVIEAAIPQHPALRWLIDAERIMAGGARDAFKRTIVSALGRIPDDAELIGVALAIVRRQPTSRVGVDMVRWYRTQRAAQ